MSTSPGHRSARQKHAQEQLRDLVQQWLHGWYTELPTWRDAVIGIEQSVEGDEIVLRFRIPGLQGGGSTDAILPGRARYVVVHRTGDGAEGLPGLALYDLQSGAPVSGFGPLSWVMPSQIVAAQVDDVLEIRLPGTGSRRRSGARHRFVTPGT